MTLQADLSTVASILVPRQHIQNFSAASELEPHWGYADRVIPCVNDAGSCAYLDVVYESHDRGMVYTAVFWLTIGGILFLWALARRVFPGPEPDSELIRAGAADAETPQQPPRSGPLTRAHRAIACATRRLLLPNAWRPLFGYNTRLQVTILAVLAGYLAIWSFVGIVYSKWVTPIKVHPGLYNTRTSLGPWADRVGVLAYALTPLSVLLASRENLLSALTGIPYTSFMFLHRWTGYIILAQSLLHTLGWVLVEAWLYQPQPQVWNMWIVQPYAIWGVVALALLVLIVVLSLPFTIRHVTGYEFFRKAHYVLAMVYIGALIGHWEQLQCFLVPGLVLWFVDRAARLVRTAMLHHGYISSTNRFGFSPCVAAAQIFPHHGHGSIVRLDFDHVQRPWAPGQHFFLCFPETSLWQSHPFTPLSLPVQDANGRVRHSYIFRAKGGETLRIANLLAADEKKTTTVILQGPYGEDLTAGLTSRDNILCVAGGTGITYVLPVLLRLVRERPTAARNVELVWAIKRAQDVDWVAPELDELQARGAPHGLKIRVFVTAEAESAGDGATSTAATADEKGAHEKESMSDSSDERATARFSVQQRALTGESIRSQRPDVNVAVKEFVGRVAQGPTRVFGSGPPGMIGDLREAVAECNSGAKVWKGEERFDVQLFCDDRLEW